MKKYIIKSKTHGSREVLLDDEVYEWVSKYKWSLTKDYTRKREAFYAQRNVKQPDGKYKSVLLHREIMNTPKGLTTHHLNGNGLDNRRANLSVCTDMENQQRKRSHIDSTSKFVGVQRTKPNSKNHKKIWLAECMRNRKRLYKEYFYTEEEAAYHRDSFMVKQFGMDVELNFPEKLNEYLNLIKQDKVNV
jgi:hypothetical protein